MRSTEPEHWSWDRLFETALGQEGLLTTEQAAAAGDSAPLLVHHVRTGRVVRPRRGIYRVVHFSASEHEELAAAWLWSERTGVISHHTALALHDLSDVLPARVHLTAPRAWRQRRSRVPSEMVLQYANVLLTLKGGLVLELRLEQARTTKDVDRRVTGSADDVLAQLQQAGRRGPGPAKDSTSSASTLGPERLSSRTR